MPEIKIKILSFIQAKAEMAAQIRRVDLKSKPLVHRVEIKIEPLDAIAWLEAQQAKTKVYGSNQDNSAAIAGIGEALKVTGDKTIDLQSVFKELRQYLTPQYPYLQWYGGFCFDDGYLDAQWREFGAYSFVLPRFELAENQGKMIFSCNLIGHLNERKREGILKELDAIVERKNKTIGQIKTQRRRDLPSQGQWERNTTTILEGIERGDYSKVVLARKTILKFPKTLNAFVILRQLHKVTPNSYHFCFQFDSTTFLGASPERLYKRKGRKILSEAIAGTSPRGETSKDDIGLKKKLLDSKKNNHEHRFVVDAIQSHLKPLCIRLNHKSKPQVISLGNGHHLITSFEGDLKKNVSDEDILKSLHPTPAVAGVPLPKALAAIRHLENFSRGWYAGPLGYVGLDWAEFVVGIRSGVVKGDELSVYAGAGIVKGSDPKEEWLEVENKISNFIKVIK